MEIICGVRPTASAGLDFLFLAMPGGHARVHCAACRFRRSERAWTSMSGAGPPVAAVGALGAGAHARVERCSFSLLGPAAVATDGGAVEAVECRAELEVQPRHPSSGHESFLQARVSFCGCVLGLCHSLPLALCACCFKHRAGGPTCLKAWHCISLAALHTVQLLGSWACYALSSCINAGGDALIRCDKAALLVGILSWYPLILLCAFD